MTNCLEIQLWLVRGSSSLVQYARQLEINQKKRATFFGSNGRVASESACCFSIERVAVAVALLLRARPRLVTELRLMVLDWDYGLSPCC